MCRGRGQHARPEGIPILELTFVLSSGPLYLRKRSLEELVPVKVVRVKDLHGRH